ncbi:hypothetical protein Glove_438g19 [Diversispora epigaea]|uniref:Uncharacterized protein n=1 Tax=Diversispora epigaea TaxID=1348612 RepID=A0A397GWA1_9GLOM|nr:hypothetical protein Glove_438g19 [Diversispora epigaea]
MSSFLSRQAAKEQGYFLNILRGSKKGKRSTSPYPKVSPKTPFKKISRQMTPEEFGSAQQSENLTGRRPLFRDITEEIARLPTPQVIIDEGSKKGKRSTSPYPKVSPKTPFKKISRQMTPEEFGSAQQSENLTGRRPLFRDITEEIARLPTSQVIIDEGGNGTEDGGNRTEDGGNRTEEDGNRTEESVASAHEASSIHGETGASQEIGSRKRRREDDDDSVPITRRDIKILLHHLEEQNEIIRRLDTEVSYVRKLLEKGGMGDFTSTDEFIKKFINAITKYSITKKIYASENELKEAVSHIGYKEFPDYFEDWDQKRWSFYYDTKISSKKGTIADKIRKTIFMTFGENDLPKITTKSSADVIKNWKECWTSRPSEEQSAFTISVIKYIFNPNIYSIQIKDEGEEEEKEITQEVTEEIKGSGEDEEGEVLATGFAIHGGNRTEEDGNRTEESVASAHEASSIHGETGASQEIVSRKRRREDDDDSVPITRRDIKILLHHLEEQNEIIRRLDTEVSYVRKLLEKGGMGDFTSTDEFIKKFINAITKYSITKKIYASENELKEAVSHIGYKEFPDYFEDWDQKRWSFYYDTKISSKKGTIADKIRKTIFMTFGENDLPKITTKSSADVIKNWKECWTSRPSEEQSAFTISVIKYIFNPNIYSIQIKDEGIRHYMKKTQEKMNANEKIQFLEEEFNEEEKEGEEEDEEGEEGRKKKRK